MGDLGLAKVVYAFSPENRIGVSCRNSSEESRLTVQINNVINTGLQGFKGAVAKADQAAQEIASQPVAGSRVASDPRSVTGLGRRGLVEPMVDLIEAEVAAKANAKVIETASEMLGSLLDATA